MFPWQRYIPAWTHDVISHSSVAKQQWSILCMVLYIAYSDAGQFIACVCQIPLVYVSLCKRYESTLSYFWLTLVIWFIYPLLTSFSCLPFTPPHQPPPPWEFCLLLGLLYQNQLFCMGAQWLSARVFDSRSRGLGLEPHRCHLSKTH